MLSVSKVLVSSSAANDKVRSAEAEVESKILHLYKCMIVLESRDIEPSKEANDILEEYFNEINKRSDIIQEAIYELIMEHCNELGQTKVDDWKIKACSIDSTVKGHQESCS